MPIVGSLCIVVSAIADSMAVDIDNIDNIDVFEMLNAVEATCVAIIEVGTVVDFAEALLRGEDETGDEPVAPVTAKLIRKRKLLVSDPEIEISKKDYSQHQKDTSNIIKKVSPPNNPYPTTPSLPYSNFVATLFTPPCLIDDTP